jgi:large subunit ribosomal protein L5
VAKQDNQDNKEQANTGQDTPETPAAEADAEVQASAEAASEPKAAKSEDRAPRAASGGGRKDGASKNGKSAPRGESYVPRLRKKYIDEVAPALRKEFNYENAMMVPRIQKVVINIGMGTEARENAKSLDNAVRDIGEITGQKAVITRAKKSIAQFKVRTGMPIGVMVTLRGPRMWVFLDKLFNVAMARVRDFSGVSPKSFDGRGNFSLGLREQLIFPEIDYDKIDKIRGMEIVIVTSAKNDEEGRRLLELMGVPFKRG